MTENTPQPWERIHNWLRANASRTFDQISAPSDAIGRWRLAGALDLFPPMYTPLSAKDSLRERDRLQDDVHPELENDPAGTMSSAFLHEFTPIAESGTGDYLFVDERPGPMSGCVRAWSGDDGNLRPTMWPSVHAMLADIAHSLETGEPVLRESAEASRAGFVRVISYTPEVIDGELSWKPVRPQAREES